MPDTSLAQKFFQARASHNGGRRLQLAHDRLELILRMMAESMGDTVKLPGRAHCTMLERAALMNPFHPSTVQHLEILVPQILQHPEHAAFVAPVIKWIGIDDDFALLVDAERLQPRASMRFRFGSKSPFATASGVAIFMPRQMHGTRI